MKEFADVLIVGGGPAGIFAAFYAGVRQLNVKLIDGQSKLGGKLHLYPDKIIWDVGGQPPILVTDYINQLTKQATTFSPTICFDELVQEIRTIDEGYIVKTNIGIHYTHSIVLANGGGAYLPKVLNKEFVSYTLESPSFYEGKDVAVVGNSLAAYEWAKHIASKASTVIQITSESKVKKGKGEIPSNITFSTFTAIKQIKKSNLQIIIDTLTENSIIVDEIICNIGYEKVNPLAKILVGSSFLEHESFQVIGDATMELHNNKSHSIISAYQDAMEAINTITCNLNPSAKKSAIVSTHNPVFEEKLKEMVR